VRIGGVSKALWILFFFLLCWPFLGGADRPVSIFGIPSVLFYIFGCWGLLIAALWTVSGRMKE